jgi:exonuclease SbcC
MCYRGDDNLLDLSGVHLACLAGDNGHGKSALLDAMTWALWGKSRARHDDDLITLGETEMEVQFDFELEGNVYRVIRKRSRTARGGRTTLDLQVQHDDDYFSQSEATVRATGAKIVALLRLDYETFINSAFLLQGRADEFTTKAPGERKKILGEILGLDRYERYEQRAKELSRECRDEVQALTGTLQEIQREVEKESAYGEAVAEAEERTAALDETLRAGEVALQALREKRREMDARKRQLSEVRKHLSQAEREKETLQRQLTEAQGKVTALQGVLAQRDEILAGYDELAKAREAVDRFGELLRKRVALNEARATVEKAIDAARHELETERKLLASRLADLEQQAAGRADAEAVVRDAEEQLAALAKHEAAVGELRTVIAGHNEEITRLITTNGRLKEEMLALEQKINALAEAEAECPLCGQGLTAEHADEIRAQYQAEGKEKGGQWRTNRERIRQLEARRQAAETEMREMERRLRERPRWQRKLAQAEQALKAAREAEERLVETRVKLQGVERRIVAREYAPAQQARLTELLGELDALGYSAEEHTRARERVEALAHFEKSFRKLQSAQDQLAAEQSRRTQLEQSLRRWQKAAAEGEEKVARLVAEIATLEQEVTSLPQMEAQVTELQAQLSDARVQLGAARQKLEYCRQQKQEYEKKKALLDRRAEEQTIYEELRLAFGARGLRAMIIESVLPEIEEEANRLLSRMTDGRMSVRFETQRETLRGSVVETLDIHISDEVGTREYHMYSGGEAFRVNFAIRVALSKLLARRAGAQLQTLVIDEGFGTQDAQGRERLTEAITAIKDDFEQVLVITHIEELKDVFPVRIDVVKMPGGTRLSIA